MWLLFHNWTTWERTHTYNGHALSIPAILIFAAGLFGLLSAPTAYREYRPLAPYIIQLIQANTSAAPVGEWEHFKSYQKVLNWTRGLAIPMSRAYTQVGCTFHCCIAGPTFQVCTFHCCIAGPTFQVWPEFGPSSTSSGYKKVRLNLPQQECYFLLLLFSALFVRQFGIYAIRNPALSMRGNCY